MHPLCSRKRSLSKIVSSPSYKQRQKKYKQPPAEKKVESVIPKFQYLQRKKRYGDNIHIKNKKTNVIKETYLPCVLTPPVEQNKEDAAGMRTPFRLVMRKEKSWLLIK